VIDMVTRLARFSVEREWLSSRCPDHMLAILGEASLRRPEVLVACACCRSIWDLLDERGQAAVAAAEGWAEGLVSGGEAHRLRRLASPVLPDREALPLTGAARSSYWAARAAAAVFPVNDTPAAHVAWCCRQAVRDTGPAGEGAYQADLLRDVFGNPFQIQTAAPGWLRWDGGVVPRMARAMQAGRSWEELPILADALQDAGCCDNNVLEHLRGPGPHVPGCWVIEMLTRENHEHT
jgi:hypothetical protein